MKRCLILFVSLLMLFNVILPASATTNVHEILVSSATGKPGETVEVKVSLGRFMGIASLKLSVEFDDVNISLIDIDYSDSLPGYTQLPETFENPATLNWYDINNFNGNCDFATLTFKINDSAYAGEYSIDLGLYLTDTLGYNSDGNIVPYEYPYVTPGKIIVESDMSDYVEVSDIILDKTSLSFDVGDTTIITATVKPENATNSEVSWYSSNESVATVDSDGKVTAMSPGKTTISAFAENSSASCKVVVNKVHSHSYIEMVPDSQFLASESSCTKRSIYYYSCSCGLLGDATFEYGAYDPHSFGDWQIVTEPTETTTGLQERTCTVCGIAKETQIIPTVGHVHNYDKMNTSSDHLVSGATCEKKAEFYYSCECGENGASTFTYGNYASHELTVHSAVDASCEDNGNIKYYECDVCNKLFTDNIGTEEITISDTVIPAKGHDYADDWSWDSFGHWNECSECGYKENEAEHTPGAPATETTDQVCTECNYVITPALNHTHSYDSEWKSDKSGHWKQCKCGETTEILSHTPGAPATETTDQVCTECNYVITPALGHTHSYSSEWKSDEANHWKECTADGCGVVIEETKSSHVSEKAENKATCTKQAVCDVCGVSYGKLADHTYTEVFKDENGHAVKCKYCEAHGEVVPHTPNIEESTADQEKVCTGCGYVMEEKKHSHTPEVIYGYSSTCAKTGLTDGSKCSECGEILVAQQIIPKLPHEEGNKVIANIVFATPYNPGSYDFVRYCVNCGEVASRQTVIVPYNNPLVPGKPYVPSMPETPHVHTYKDINGYEATCEYAGLTSGSVCADCGSVLVAQEVIPANGHTCSEFLIENKVEATAKTDGSYDIVCYCTVCGEELSRVDVVIPATGGIENPETSDDGETSKVLVLPVVLMVFVAAAVFAAKRFTVK